MWSTKLECDLPTVKYALIGYQPNPLWSGNLSHLISDLQQSFECPRFPNHCKFLCMAYYGGGPDDNWKVCI